MGGPSPLPPGVVAFLDAHIFTLAQLEVLLLVHEARGRPCPLEELARRSYVPASSLQPWLDEFTGRGLLAVDADGAYVERTEHPALQAVLDDVADIYARRKVSVARHVYATKEDDPAVRLAAAFRFRKDKPR